MTAKTDAERKANQRLRTRERQLASAENVDAMTLQVLKKQCNYRRQRLVRRDIDISELVDLIASEFPLEEQQKVRERLGLPKFDVEQSIRFSAH